MTASDACYRLVVAGRLSATVTQLIDSRFGAAASTGRDGRDSVVHLTGDQPALRTMLTLLWDLGQELVALATGPDAQPAEHAAPARRVPDRTQPSCRSTRSGEPGHRRTSGSLPTRHEEI